MNVVKEIDRINELELKNGIYGGLTKGSWHDQYSESAWVYIGGLSYELSEGDIICVMSQWGEIEDINLVREKGTNKSQGFCFLKYEDQRSTILAVDNFNGVKLLGRVVRCDHVEKYKLPKEVRDKETEMLENDPSAQISIGPGHAYKDVELENDYNINSGIDLWNQAPEAAVEEVRASREESKQKKEKKEKKEKKDKKEKKVKKEHKHENKDKEIDSVDDNRRDKEKGERDRHSGDRRVDTFSREHHHRREDSRSDRGRDRSRDRSSRDRRDNRDGRDSRDRNRDRSRDRRGSECDGGREGRDRGVDRREHGRRGERESGREDRSQRSSDHKRHRDDRDESDRREDRRDSRRIDNNSSSSSSGVPAATLPSSSVPMPKLGGAATGFSMEAQGPVASWRGSRDPVVQSQATVYGNKNFGPKKTFVSELGPDGKPVVDNSNKRGEFAGFGGMNRLR